MKRDDTESDVDVEYNEVEEEDDEDEFTPDDAEKSGSALRSDLHVIYRRRNSHLDHSSDYRE